MSYIYISSLYFKYIKLTKDYLISYSIIIIESLNSLILINVDYTKIFIIKYYRVFNIAINIAYLYLNNLYYLDV